MKSLMGWGQMDSKANRIPQGLGLGLCAVALLLGATVSRAATIVRYGFDSESYYAATRVDPNVDADEITPSGFGGTWGPTSGYFTFNNNKISDQGILTFGFTPAENHSLTLSEFNFNFIGPQDATLSYSLGSGDSFANIGSLAPSCNSAQKL